MSDLDPVCIHNVVRSICPWKDCNPNFAEEPDYRNLPEDIRGDGEAQDSRGEVGPELESPRDCIGACGYQSRCYAHRDGIEWERQRVIAELERMLGVCEYPEVRAFIPLFIEKLRRIGATNE